MVQGLPEWLEEYSVSLNGYILDTFVYAFNPCGPFKKILVSFNPKPSKGTFSDTICIHICSHLYGMIEFF